MRGLLFLAILGAGGWLLLNHVGVAGLDPRGVGTVIDGNQVVKADGDVETRFTRAGSLEGTWMLFGGDTTRRRNQATDGSFAGLPLEHARAIAARHPDFHLCRSPGAADAKRHVQSVNVIAADSAAQRTLAEAVELFHERLGQGGERTCVSIHGAPLSLASARIKQNGEDITADLAPLFARSDLVLAEQVEIRDCRALLGR